MVPTKVAESLEHGCMDQMEKQLTMDVTVVLREASSAAEEMSQKSQASVCMGLTQQVLE